MSEMIERVALAISGGDDPASILAIHRSRARLAIEAMREPTSKMLLRANRLPACDTLHFGDIAKIWQVMVDEAGK